MAQAYEWKLEKKSFSFVCSIERWNLLALCTLFVYQNEWKIVAWIYFSIGNLYVSGAECWHWCKTKKRHKMEKDWRHQHQHQLINHKHKQYVLRCTSVTLWIIFLNTIQYWRELAFVAHFYNYLTIFKWNDDALFLL